MKQKKRHLVFFMNKYKIEKTHKYIDYYSIFLKISSKVFLF